MKIKLLSVVLLSIFLISCGNSDKKKHIAEINAMEITLDSLNVIVWDSTRMSPNDIVYSVRETIAKIKDNYKPDTIDYILANQMNSYKEIRKIVSRNSGNMAKAKQAIPEVQKKLADLKHDVENGVNDRDKYQEYINFEKEKIEEIKHVLSYYLETTEEYYERYDSLHPIIKNIADSLAKTSND